jgi:hypothetical protein
LYPNIHIIATSRDPLSPLLISITYDARSLELAPPRLDVISEKYPKQEGYTGDKQLFAACKKTGRDIDGYLRNGENALRVMRVGVGLETTYTIDNV